jgi:hypothetical protein
MLKNISSMNKKDEKELLEIPEFLKKLSQEHPQTEKVETVIEEKFVSITNIQQVETKVIKKVKPKIDIQAKIKEHTQNYYIDIKDIIDQHTEGEQAESVYEYCKEHDIALTYCSKLLELVNDYKHEPSVGLEARNVKQDERTEEQQDLYEAYQSFTTKEMQGMISVFDIAVSDIERWGKIKQGEKKARKPRAISVERMVKKLQYKQSDERYKLQSIDPILIPRCQMVWVFNTKTRKLTQYNAVGRNGIMVKGTTLKDYDTDISVSKTVRKPDAILSKLLNTDGKIAMRNIWNTINTTETKANGRINADTVILKVLK